MTSLLDSSWLFWLENTTVITAIPKALWFYPIIKTAHIFSVAMLFSSITVLDLRMLGFYRKLLVTRFLRYVVLWNYLNFEIVTISGFCMFAVNAEELVFDPIFRWKLFSILAAVVNAVFFDAQILKSLELNSPHAAVPLLGKVLAVFSLVLCAVAIALSSEIACH